MSNTNPTQQNWHIEEETDGQLWIFPETENRAIAKITHAELIDKTLEITEEDKATALLMAAAPNMFRALLTARKTLATVCSMEQQRLALIQISEAMEKATKKTKP